MNKKIYSFAYFTIIIVWILLGLAFKNSYFIKENIIVLLSKIDSQADIDKLSSIASIIHYIIIFIVFLAVGMLSVNVYSEYFDTNRSILLNSILINIGLIIFMEIYYKYNFAININILIIKVVSLLIGIGVIYIIEKNKRS